MKGSVVLLLTYVPEKAFPMIQRYRIYSDDISISVAGTPTVAESVQRKSGPWWLTGRAIATVLSDMDTEIAALEHRLDKTRAIKQGMMQQLLTGAIRLPVPETEEDPSQ